MGINFNIVKKPKVEEDDGEELEEEVVEEEEVKTKGYDPKKKMLRFMAIIVVVMLLVLLVLFIASSFGKTKNSGYSYSQIENILEKAGKSYFKDNPSYLPIDDGDIVEVDSTTLVEAGKMKDLSEYPTKDNTTCTGSVKVLYEDDEYLYSPVLNCGDKYSTVALASKIFDNEETITTGDGLYSRSGEYIFRGENVNNYVQLDKSLWRIVKITSSDEIVLISNEGIGRSAIWDNRYNEQKKYSTGINDYSVSRIKDHLESIYKNTEEKSKEHVLSKKDRSRMVSYNVCIGKRLSNSEDKLNTEECKETLKDQKMGLLTLSDYLYASVDPNCKSSETRSCSNYNYLVTDFDWWLATTNKENTYQVYRVRSGGSITSDNASGYAFIRAVIRLNNGVLYNGGQGTEKNPYKVR